MISPRGQLAAVGLDIDPEYLRKRTGTRHVTGRVLDGPVVTLSRQHFRLHYVNVTRANEVIGKVEAARICAEPSQTALL